MDYTIEGVTGGDQNNLSPHLGPNVGHESLLRSKTTVQFVPHFRPAFLRGKT